MKKVLIPFFSCLLVLTLLLGSFGSAKAEVGDDPVVTPISGDMEFTTEIVPIVSLPGTIEMANLMLAPAGFPEGEAQYEGAGIRVTGMESGKASACFTLYSLALKQGWGGKVGVWNGTKWDQLSTTITIPEESSSSLACATITGSGTYAFIKYVVDPSLLPIKQECDFTIIPAFWPYSPIGETTLFSVAPNLVFSAIIPTNPPTVGTPVYYKLLKYTPAGSVFGSFSGTVPHGKYGINFADFVDLHVEWTSFISASLYVEFPSCWAILDYDKSTIFD